MSKKLTFALLIIVSIFITSCQKEIKSSDSSSSQVERSITNPMAGINENAIKYRALSAYSYSPILKNHQAKKENVGILTLNRKQSPNMTEELSTGNSIKKMVIHVPRDFTTLQTAIDNSQNGGTIIVDGTVTQSGNVMVDIPNLTIKGDGDQDEESSAINDNSNAGDNLIISVPGVTVNNLKLVNLGIVISSTNGVRLTNLNEINSNPGVADVIALLSSENNILNNCKVNGGNASSGAADGIFLDDFSNNNQISNCRVDNTQFAAYAIEGSNNRINNCEAVNFDRGFISFDGASTGNIYADCDANHSFADAGFIILCFATNNNTVTIKNCTSNDNLAFASIVVIGGSATIINCTASSNTRNTAGNTPYGIIVTSAGQTGEFVDISGCTANANTGGGIGIQNLNFLIKGNTCNRNLQVVPGEGAVIGLLNLNGLPMSGTLEGNITDNNSNNAIGIYLFGVTNSTIDNNRSMNNALCDFNQTNSSGNILINNHFGSSCMGL